MPSSLRIGLGGRFATRVGVTAGPDPEEPRLRLARVGSVTVLDTRPATAYPAGHAFSSLRVGLGGQFAARAGVKTGPDREEPRLRLARVGIERVQGVLRDGIAGWDDVDLPLFLDAGTAAELNR